MNRQLELQIMFLTAHQKALQLQNGSTIQSPRTQSNSKDNKTWEKQVEGLFQFYNIKLVKAFKLGMNTIFYLKSQVKAQPNINKFYHFYPSNQKLTLILWNNFQLQI